MTTKLYHSVLFSKYFVECIGVGKSMAFKSVIPTVFLGKIYSLVPWVKTHGYHIDHASGILKLRKSARGTNDILALEFIPGKADSK